MKMKYSRGMLMRDERENENKIFHYELMYDFMDYAPPARTCHQTHTVDTM